MDRTSRMTSSWIALGLALTGTAFGQLFFKMYFDRRWLGYLGIALTLFILTPLCTYYALRRLDIGLVYMSTGISQVMILVLARFVLHEEVNLNHVFAAILIVTGVIFFAI